FAYVSTSLQFKINNLTTEESFVYKRIENRTNIKIQGLVVTRGLCNAFRLTNRKFISLAPGVNRIKISGGTFESLSINTKFYYKSVVLIDGLLLFEKRSETMVVKKIYPQWDREYLNNINENFRYLGGGLETVQSISTRMTSAERSILTIRGDLTDLKELNVKSEE